MPVREQGRVDKGRREIGGRIENFHQPSKDRDGEDATSTPSRIRIAVSASTVAASATLQFTADVIDQNGAIMSSVQPSAWVSSDPSIATVDGNGLVTGVAAGQTSIAASLATASGPINSNPVAISVTAPVVDSTPAAVAIAPTAVDVATGAVAQLTATVRNAAGDVISSRSPDAWDTTNAGVASVNSSGLVTGVAAGGPVNITATITSPSLTSNVAAVSVHDPAPILSFFPEIPNTATVITSQPMVSVIPDIGHTWLFGSGDFPERFQLTASDDPVSPPSEYVAHIPPGQAGGGVGNTSQAMYYNLAADNNENNSTWHDVYIGMVFKIDSPYINSAANGDKLFYFFETFTPPGVSSGIWLLWASLDDAGTVDSPARLWVYAPDHFNNIYSGQTDPAGANYSGPATSYLQLTVGHQYRVVMRLKQSSVYGKPVDINSGVYTPGDGIVQIWIKDLGDVDPLAAGALQINRQNLSTVGADTTHIGILNQVWEWGGGGVSTIDLYRRTRHIVIAGAA